MAASLTYMLKITANWPLASDLEPINKDITINEISDSNNEIKKANKVSMKWFKLAKSKKSETGFFTLKAKLALTKLKQTFGKALILYYFNQKYHIWIKNDASDYIIYRILTQLTLNNLSS